MTTSFEWRGGFDNREVNVLHAAAFEHPLADVDWWTRVNRHSLGWAAARRGGDLVGFANVPWDGAGHAFLVDVMIAARLRHQGLGAQLVSVVAAEVRAAGCRWLHVDFEDHLRGFYLDACGFRPTSAGLIAL